MSLRVAGRRFTVDVELAAIHIVVCFFLIASTSITAAATRLTNDRLPLIIVMEPFNKVINQHRPRTFGIVV